MTVVFIETAKLRRGRGGAMKNCWVWRCVRINFANLHNGTCRVRSDAPLLYNIFHPRFFFFFLVCVPTLPAIIILGRVEIIR